MIPPAMRSTAEKTLVDQCTVTRPGTGPRVVDPVTLELVGPADVTVWTGPCSYSPTGGVGANAAAIGGADVTADTVTLRLPAGTPPMAPGDAVTVAATDLHPEVTVTVRTVDDRSMQVLRRCTCTIATSAPGFPA